VLGFIQLVTVFDSRADFSITCSMRAA